MLYALLYTLRTLLSSAYRQRHTAPAPQHTPDLMQRDEVTLLAHAHATPDHNICTAPHHNKRTTQHGTRHGAALHTCQSPDRFPEPARKPSSVSNVTIQDPKSPGGGVNRNRFPKLRAALKIVHSPFLIYLS